MVQFSLLFASVHSWEMEACVKRATLQFHPKLVLGARFHVAKSREGPLPRLGLLGKQVWEAPEDLLRATCSLPISLSVSQDTIQTRVQ